VTDLWSKPGLEFATPRFLDFKTTITSKLVERAAGVFVQNQAAILEGSYAFGLLEGAEPEALLLATLKNVSKKHVYTSRQAEGIEIVGDTVISGLLDHLAPLLRAAKTEMLVLIDPKGRPKNNLNRRLFNRLAPKYKAAYKYAFDNKCRGQRFEDCLEWFYRAHLVTDYISGMTDNYALDTYQLFCGIKLED
jgi:dGTPase